MNVEITGVTSTSPRFVSEINMSTSTLGPCPT